MFTFFWLYIWVFFIYRNIYYLHNPIYQSFLAYDFKSCLESFRTKIIKISNFMVSILSIKYLVQLEFTLVQLWGANFNIQMASELSYHHLLNNPFFLIFKCFTTFLQKQYIVLQKQYTLLFLYLETIKYISKLYMLCHYSLKSPYGHRKKTRFSVQLYQLHAQFMGSVLGMSGRRQFVSTPPVWHKPLLHQLCIQTLSEGDLDIETQKTQVFS